ncbi:acidic repeat-containing protein [Nannospalax galili]|uniref:acidic repeat-containing protein n=1 Tax=Nannospalax galili TaxID=1026970 RepID=UPI000819C234|nr:acidic repeat-containing protein [Nannospalax galili]
MTRTKRRIRGPGSAFSNLVETRVRELNSVNSANYQYEASGKLEIFDTDDKPSIQKPSAVIVIDDDNDKTNFKGSELKGGESPEWYQISSEEDVEECVIVSSPDSAGEKLVLGENPGEPLSNPELKKKSIKAQKSTGGMTASVQPKKRKGKSKNTCMLSVASERKKQKPSQKKPIAAKVEKSKTGKSMCKIPGCFLSDIVTSKQYSGRKFKRNKEELVHKIYTLLNHTVFDSKMPEKIEITWNKKMLQTAGLCTTKERQQPKRERYVQIAISQKVCDSPDRIRDTLIHELCHAASWLLDGIRDSHGHLWQYYAQKCTAVHPELPEVTRCHNYAINYKIYYECSQCKFRVGRYTRSLNTKRFICARCKGHLVLLPLFRKDGTPIVPHVRPFAKYVQENYRAVFKETAGISHGDVMKKLSKNYFASKQKKDP